MDFEMTVPTEQQMAESRRTQALYQAQAFYRDREVSIDEYLEGVRKIEAYVTNG